MASDCTCGCCQPNPSDIHDLSREDLERDIVQAERHIEEVKRRLREILAAKA